LGEAKKFGIYITETAKRLNEKTKKRLDASPLTRLNSIHWFTDKMYCPECNVTYPEFTSQHFSFNKQE
jgi:excinuclease UvrABC ATPase subunit